MTAWGEVVVGWLDLRGDERVLDAGCGTGRVTALLRDRLPRGRVIAVDGSASMIERARERLGRDRVEYLVADLQGAAAAGAAGGCGPVHGDVPLDHGPRCVVPRTGGVLDPAGQLAAQCGGAGNIASIEAALRAMGEDFRGRKHFATPEATRARLEAAGFIEVETAGSRTRRRSCPEMTSSPTWKRSAWAITCRGWKRASGALSFSRWRAGWSSP